MLYYPESNSLAEFPSPASLLHRIMISTKPPKEYLESRNPIVKQKDNNVSPSSEDEQTPGTEETIQTLESMLFDDQECESKVKKKGTLLGRKVIYCLYNLVFFEF